MRVELMLMWLGVLVVLALGAASGCDRTPVAGLEGPTVSIDVAALSLTGVGDVVWDLELVNGRQPTPDVVWRQRLASSRFGDGAGSVSYVGPCDATQGVHENTVRLWVVGVYSDPLADAGDFGEAPPDGAVAFENPTPYDGAASQWTAPLTHSVTCRENADAPVRFDVALMRPAGQGFFDIALNFDDIFCSAKFDCCVENATGTACASDITLLHDEDGERGPTMVLAFACTAGVGEDAATTLHLDALELDCTDPAGAFGADIVIDPTGGPGNLCATAGATETCDGVVGATTPNHLFQVAVYRGFELLSSGGAPANKAYWNVALGVKRPAISGCRLRSRGTAAREGDGGVVTQGTIAAGAVYPFVRWEVDLAACRAEQVSYGDPTAMVRVEYTRTGEGPTGFAFSFGPDVAGGAGGGAAACGLLGVPCPAGFVCDTSLAQGSRYEAFCVTDGVAPALGEFGEMVFVPPGPFWMGCNSASDAHCFQDELPQHEVTLGAYAVDRLEVSSARYSAWCEASPEDPGDPSGCAPFYREGDLGEPSTYPPANGGGTLGAHPANYIGHSQATAYCEAHGKRLCTEAEWERAARGGCETVSGICQTATRIYPWGDDPPVDCEQVNHGPCQATPYTAEVGVLPGGASPYGARDLGGNVSEWVSGWYAPYPLGSPYDPAWPGGMWVYRGGDFTQGSDDVRASERHFRAEGEGVFWGLGFRCCRTYP